jgi:uncharacterized protein
MRKLFVGFLVIAFSICLVTVSGAQVKDATKIRLGTNKMGSFVYDQSVVLANLLEPKIQAKVFVEPSSGSSAQGILLSRAEADLGILPAAHCLALRLGSKGFEKDFPEYVGKATPVRLLMVGHVMPFGILMRKKSQVDSIAGLKGKKIFGECTGSAGFEAAMRGYLAAAGLEYNKDVKVLSMSSGSEGMDRVIMGEADGVVASSGGAKMREFASSDGGVFINAPIDPKSIQTYRKYYPAVVGWTADKDGPCIKKGTRFFGIPHYLIATSKLNDEMAYRVTKVTIENLAQLIKMNAAFKDWSKEGTVHDPQIPLHPGAVRYYKEAGIWNAKLEETQKNLLSAGL